MHYHLSENKKNTLSSKYYRSMIYNHHIKFYFSKTSPTECYSKVNKRLDKRTKQRPKKERSQKGYDLELTSE